MACLHPLIIRNRRYFNQPEDYVVSQLLLHPEDVARQRLIVPCGRCSECLRAERNSWYLRLNREFAYQRSMGRESWFVTLTISPVHYSAALANPSSFIRRFFEKIRHRYGVSVKHAFFIEFSPKKGRMHFHGCLFGPGLRYSDLHALASEFGWIWIAPCRTRMLRYVVKYIVKDIGTPLNGGQLVDPKYRRKFVSAHVGDYLGGFPPPSFEVRSWSFRDPRIGTLYDYSIPRYYDKYCSEEDRRKRSIYSGLLFARKFGLSFPAQICLEVAKKFFRSSFGRIFSPERIHAALSRVSVRESFFPPSLVSDLCSGLSPNLSFCYE